MIGHGDGQAPEVLKVRGSGFTDIRLNAAFQFFERVLDLRNKLREVHVERDDRHGDLPPFENFGMDFADDADGFARDENAAGTAVQKRRMLQRLKTVLLTKVVQQHIETRMDF